MGRISMKLAAAAFGIFGRDSRGVVERRAQGMPIWAASKKVRGSPRELPLGGGRWPD